MALCGILLVNIGGVTHFGERSAPVAANLHDPSGWLQLLVQQRFFPIFSVLFGIGFSLLLRSASRRARHPRVVLLRRLAVLLPLGAAHQLLQPGEALLVYAGVGLVVLLPSSWLPRSVVAAAAAVCIPLAVWLADGGLLLVPGMFLLGSALVRYGLVDRVEDPRVRWAWVAAGLAAATVPALAWQLQDVAGSGFTRASAVAGLTMAALYVSGVLALMQTRARAGLRAVFEPLGRMALTNYVSATPLMALLGHLLDLPRGHRWGLLLGLAVAILLAQQLVSTWWLRRHRQGPLEWLWLTWGVRPGVPSTAEPEPSS